VNETANSAYQVLVDAAVILYFIPFLYMYAAAIKLSYSKNREADEHAILIPGGRAGVWLAGGLGFAVTLMGIILSLVPPGDSANRLLFELKLICGTAGAIAIGMVLYYRGMRQKRRGA
jgi:amino acid transporter